MDLPRYPIFIPTKERSDVDLTASYLRQDGVPFTLVIEPQEFDIYAAHYGKECLLVLPENDRGLIYVRNWIKDYATALGVDRHWQIDDNIAGFRRWYKGARIRCHSAIALRVCEDFSDRYTNVAISGLNYSMFAVASGQPPFVLNAHVYSCTLILNEIPHRFRPPANEDVDMCLQVLSDGWCTVQINAFLCEKKPTMTIPGGQTDIAYRGDGRLDMARALERAWPGVVRTGRRYNRPQHVVHSGWRKFDTALIPREGVEISREPNEYGMRLKRVAKVRSESLSKLATSYNREQGRKAKNERVDGKRGVVQEPA